jgi:hypothetical protein
MADPITFRSVVELGGKTATGIPVPDDVVTALGSTKRPAVSVTVGGYTYRTTVAPMGGRYFVPLSAENRTSAGVAAGDEVNVSIALDTAPRTVDVPADLATALAQNNAVKAAFDKLSYSNQRRLVLSVEGAKTDETRQRRIAKAIDELAAG